MRIFKNNDYIDSLPERWECPVCNKIHEYEDSALYCCQDEPEEEDDDDDE